MSDKEESKEYFWLKTVSEEGEKSISDDNFDNLFIRLVGSGSEAVVLTEQSPKYLRSHLSFDGHLCFTSSAPQHAGRQWSFVLDQKREDSQSNTNRPAWAPVLIRECEGDKGFSFVNTIATTSEHLALDLADFNGFVVCQWVYGHPQLFWLTEAFKGDLPKFMQRVKFIKSPYLPSS